MNLKVLPPKRFQDPFDPYFDPVRHEQWYPKLLKRRMKNARLRMAYNDIMVHEIAGIKDYTQKWIAGHYGVHPRELRDYIAWASKSPYRAVSVPEQSILDGAYRMYSNEGWPPLPPIHPFGKCIRHVAALAGERGRPIEEMWEVRWDFWPSVYQRRGQ